MNLSNKDYKKFFKLTEKVANSNFDCGVKNSKKNQEKAEIAENNLIEYFNNLIDFNNDNEKKMNKTQINTIIKEIVDELEDRIENKVYSRIKNNILEKVKIDLKLNNKDVKYLDKLKGLEDNNVDKVLDLSLPENQFFNAFTKKQYKGEKIIEDCKKHSFQWRDKPDYNLYATEKQLNKLNRLLIKEERENYVKFSIPVKRGFTNQYTFICNKYYNINQSYVDEKYKIKRRLQIGEKLRFKIFQRDNYTCQYCGRTKSDGAILQIDHIIPISKGGTNDESNLITCCQECNIGKSNNDL